MIILIIAMLLENFAHIPAVQHAFGGIRVAVAALIANAVIKLISKNVTSPLAIILCIGAFAAITFLSLSPVLVVFIAAIAGISAKAVAK